MGKCSIHVPSSLFDPGEGELMEGLLERPGCRIERIFSRGHHSPEGFWYDQQEGEFVLLISGAAQLRLRQPDELIDLQPGDYLQIAPHREHRVEWTDPNTTTVWLAVFYRPQADTQG